MYADKKKKALHYISDSLANYISDSLALYIRQFSYYISDSLAKISQIFTFHDFLTE